jgi:hypothetical protein
MSKHKGKPSAINKSESGTGIPSVIKPGSLRNDKILTEKYTDDDKKIASHVRLRKSNRNTDKENPTNAHGYKN